MISNALKQSRINAGLTQGQVAKQLDILETSYSKYEQNQRNPSIDVLIKLADFYNISLDELVGRKFPK